MTEAKLPARWRTLAEALASSAGRVSQVGHISPAFLSLLDRIPWMASSFGFERELGLPALPDVDLAVHFDPRHIAPPGSDKAWDALRDHPLWRQTISLPAHLDHATEVALEFDASRAHQGVPLPVLFLVRDDLITGDRTEWTDWTTRVRTEWLPAARGEAALPGDLDRTLRQVLDRLPAGARAVHFGSLAVRGLEALRVCVAGATAADLEPFAGQLGFALTALRGVELLASLPALGDLRYINLDLLGSRVLPRLGLELHLPGAPTRQGLAPLARIALSALANAGLVRADEIESIDGWCGLDGDGLARTLTHVKLQLAVDGPPRLKAYLKVSPGTIATATSRPAVQRTTPWPPARLHDGFIAQASQRPDAVALLHSGASHTYADLDRASCAIAHRLLREGVKPGDLVGIRLAHGPLQAAAALGVVRTGAAYVPADASWPPARVAEVFSRAGVPVVLSAPGEVLGSWRTLEVDDGLWLETADPVPDTSTPSSLAYVIFTSGSTGQPKGVVVTHRAAVNTLDDVRAHCRLGAEDRVLALSSLAFDLSVFDLFGTFAAGATLVYPDSDPAPLPARAARSLTRDRVTIWNSVPATLGLTLEFLPERPSHHLRCALLSGDWIPTPLPTRIWSRLGGEVEVTSLGGSTEGAVWSILHDVKPQDLLGPSVPYGRPTSMRGQAVLPVRPDGTPCAVDEVGELAILGTGVAEGYYGDPELTAARFPADPLDGTRTFRTGDYGLLRADGLVQFLGRRDAQVKIQGFRVDLSEITSRLLAVRGVREAVVGVVSDPNLPPRLAAVVVPQPDDPCSVSALLASLGSVLPRYCVPLAPDVRLVPALPLTSNGKLDRAELFGSPAPAAPAGPGVDDVLEVVRQALGNPAIGASDDLFDCGGDSLAAAWIARALEAAHGRPVGVADVYVHPSAAALAVLVATPAAAPPPLLAVPELPGSIDPRGLAPARDGAPVFLTGATGHIGPHALQALRARGRNVVCLVRAESVDHGRQRIRRALSRAGLPSTLDGIRVVLGDVTEPALGLEPAAFQALADEVGEVIHLAASVGFFRPAAELERCNVGGTLEVLRLAATGAIHPVCLVSTAAVHGLLHEQDVEAREEALPQPPPAARGVIEGAYPWSKWAAERIAREAEARGVPLCVVRPALVLGDTRSGAVIADDDLLAAALRCGRAAGALPMLPWTVPAMPVDIVGDAVVALALESSARGLTFQLVPPRGLSLGDLAAAWRDEGLGIRDVPWPVWRGLLEERAARGDRDARLVLQGTSADLDHLRPPRMSTANAERLLGPLVATRPGDIRALTASASPAQQLARFVAAVDVFIEELSWPPDPHETSLINAVRDALDRRGKRLRPALCLAIATSEGVALDDALPVAAALELIHTMSLVHDDLPCMDDAEIRHEAPSLHRRHGEARAVLAGNKMLARAFELVAEAAGVEPARRVRVSATVARACGGEGLAGGQAFDLFGRGKAHLPEALEDLAARKTGALFAAACRVGAEAAGAESLVEPLERFGGRLGVLFQMTDDLRDLSPRESDGKPVGRDAAQQVPNLVQRYGVAHALAVLEREGRACEADLRRSGERPFRPLLRHVLHATLQAGRRAAADAQRHSGDTTEPPDSFVASTTGAR